MATPVCPGCGHSFFSASEIEVNGMKDNATVVHCARCGVVLGVLDRENMNNAVSQLTERLEDIEFKISNFIK